MLALASSGCGESDLNIGDGSGPQARTTWGEPAGEPRALVILLHGGGWQPSPEGYEQQKATGEMLQDLGYATVAVGYDEGALGFRQIEDVYAEARRRYPDLPICAAGQSAGGHLSLMLAVREPDLACVIDLVGPTDFTTLREHGGDAAYEGAATAFGKANLPKFSPARYADQIKAKVLMILAETDPLVPEEQGRELAELLPGSELVILPEGPVTAVWAHSAGVQPDALDNVVQLQLDFLEQATSGVG